MYPKKYIYLLLVCLLATATASAQFLDYGTDPMRYRWNQVKLPHYKIIYPHGMDSLAYRYALYLENVYIPVGRSLGMTKTPTYPVVLHPGNMVANGMVSWAPRRMELLTTPSFKQHAETWEQHLTIHESRHIFQSYKLTTGLFRPLYFLIGEQSAGISAAFVPRWFFEGDAVVTETALSDAGRGRLPEFQMIYRTRMLAGRFYSFDKWHFGSYRDNTGTYYTLGYNLASFARYKYGTDVWDRTTSRYVRHPISFPTFSNAFRKNTGVGFNRLFKETFDFLYDDWASLDSGFITPTYLSPPVKRYTSYQYPQQLDDSTVISLKSSYRDINSIVAITNGRERRLAYAGIVNGRILLHRNRVYWTENVPSLRWSQEIHSSIRFLDLQDGKTQTLNPQLKRVIHISASDATLAASTFTEDGRSFVVLLDIDSDDRETARFAAPPNSFIKETVSGDGLIYASIIDEKGIAIQALDTASGQWASVLDHTRANITSLAWNNGRLYFESGLDGINNIYCIDIKSRKAYRLTASRFGSFQPAIGNDTDSTLIFAEYQPNGYRIAAQQTDSLEWQQADFANPYRYTIAERMSEQEGNKFTTIPEATFDFIPRPYNKLAHLFNVHSWTPIYYNVKDIMNSSADDFVATLRPGASIISQNALNTAITQAGWYYDGRHHAVLNFTYSGLLPVINLNLNYGGTAYDLLWNRENDKIIISTLATKRTGLTFEAQTYIPFNLNRGQHVRGIRPSLTYSVNSDRYQQYPSRRMPFFQQLLSEILVYDYRRMATQEILPRWGFQLRLQQLSMPFNPSTSSDLYAARLTTYLPGIVRPHSLMLRFGYQYQDLEGKMFYGFKQLLDAPRGQSFNYYAQHHATFKADYAFPIVMPDMSISSIAYIKRIRMNLFYDLTLTQAYNSSKWDRQNSAGLDILFDWNAFRFYFPLVHGIRLTHPIDYGTVRAEIVSSISF